MKRTNVCLSFVFLGSRYRCRQGFVDETKFQLSATTVVFEGVMLLHSVKSSSPYISYKHKTANLELIRLLVTVSIGTPFSAFIRDNSECSVSADATCLRYNASQDTKKKNRIWCDLFFLQRHCRWRTP